MDVNEIFDTLNTLLKKKKIKAYAFAVLTEGDERGLMQVGAGGMLLEKLGLAQRIIHTVNMESEDAEKTIEAAD